MDTSNNLIDVFFEVEPFGKQRPRIGKWGGYTPKKTEDAENSIRDIFTSKMGSFSPLNEPLMVSLVFFFKVPKSYTKGRVLELQKNPVYDKKPDIDNVAKLVLDALNGVAWMDDNLVCQLMASKQYAIGCSSGIRLIVSKAIPISGSPSCLQ